MAKYHIEKNCISCGMCVDIAPECIKMDSAEAYFCKEPSTDDEVAKCEEAKQSCPVDAIKNDG